MHDILNSPATWIILAAISELIGLSPLKDNSIIQILLRTAKSLNPKNR